MDKYIIVEIIPTTRYKNTGDIAQLCALKYDNGILSNIKLRLSLDKIEIPDILNMINYDKDKFKYLNSTNEIMNEFKKWAKDYTLIIIPNDYTKEYLSDLENEKVSICEIIKIDFSDNLINDITNTYSIKSNMEIVDIIYEAIKNMK